METERKTEQHHEKAIKTKMRALGVYRKEFDETIKRTAALYVRRDKLEEQFEASGCNAVVGHTNKAGANNLTKNPILSALNEVEGQLLSHEKELGLTPAALKKINESSLAKSRTGSTLAEALKKLS